jgi:hypothetical protein
MTRKFIHGHAHAGDEYNHVVDTNLGRTLCGKNVLALARGLLEATCPVCIRIYHEQHKDRAKK